MPSHANQAESGALLQRRIFWTLLGLGAVLRLVFFAVDQEIWRDEANLLMALRQTPYAGLGVEMPYGQRAPWAWAACTKAMMEAGAWSWVRLPSLVAGLMFLPLFRLLAERLLGKASMAAVFAVGLCAFSPSLVLFSNQVKPYGIDALVVVLLLLPWVGDGATHAAQGQAAGCRQWTHVPAWVGAVLLSISSVFVIGTVALARFFRQFPKQVVAAVSGGGLSALVFAWFYLMPASAYAYMDHFWSQADKFARLSLGWWVEAGFVTFYNPLRYPSHVHEWLPLGALLLMLGIAGVIRLALSRRWLTLWLMTGPVLLALALSALKLYPYSGRLIVYSTPLVLLLAGLGYGWIGGRWRHLRDGCGLILLLFLAFQSGVEFLRPQAGVRADLRHLEALIQEGDWLVTDLFAAQIVNFEQASGRWSHGNVLAEWEDETTESQKPPLQETLARLPARSRVWFLAAAVDYHRAHTAAIRPEAEHCIVLLSQNRNVERELRRPRSTLILFSPVVPQP
jgi:hypothetical protein